MEWFMQWYIYILCYYRPYLPVCAIWNEDKDTSQGKPSQIRKTENPIWSKMAIAYSGFH